MEGSIAETLKELEAENAAFRAQLAEQNRRLSALLAAYARRRALSHDGQTLVGASEAAAAYREADDEFWRAMERLAEGSE